MEQVKNAKECIMSTYKVMSTDPPRTLRWLSTGSGILLILGGLSGALNPFSIIHPLSMIISVYNVLFGVLIVLTELKTFPIIKTFQKRVDVYFHLLSVPRGKGGFYCFIGFLAFFSSTDDSQTLSRICVLIVSVVGVLHLLACKRCGGECTHAQRAIFCQVLAPRSSHISFPQSAAPQLQVRARMCRCRRQRRSSRTQSRALVEAVHPAAKAPGLA